MIDAYIKLIENTINSNSWKDNGGDTGMISEMNGLLVITQTEDTHRQIDELLNQLNEKQARLVRVRAHWIMGTPEQLQFADKGGGATREIDPQVLNKLPKEVVHHRAEIVCFSGQTVTLKSGSEHAYVSDLSPVVGTQAVGYDPTVGTAEDGALLEITPAVQADGKGAWLDVKSTVSDWGTSTKVSIEFKGASTTTATTQPIAMTGEAVLERPNMTLQSFRTSMRVPIGKAVMVGGMTIQPGLESPNGPQMLLIVEVFVD